MRASSVALSTTSSAADVCAGKRARYALTRSSAARCRFASMVLAMRRACGCCRCRRSASKAADNGARNERATTGSIAASRTSAALHTPRSCMRLSTLSRAARAASGWRSGRSRLGDCGNTASNAASARDSRPAGLPRYAHEAASTPSIGPPNGAWLRYRSRICALLRCASSCSARRICTSLPRKLCGIGSMIRATCMVSVEPPETMRPWRRPPARPRSSAYGFTPGWR